MHELWGRLLTAAFGTKVQKIWPMPSSLCESDAAMAQIEA